MDENANPPVPPRLYPPPMPPVIGGGVPPVPPSSPPPPSFVDRWKKRLGPFGVVLVLIAKFFSQIKLFLWPVLKFLPIILKTGGTMLLSIGVYAILFGVWYAVGFVLLIFVHECGHLIAARRCGLKVGAPVFIPFMGAVIALKEAPRNAWIEAQVGIGGPLLGSIGAAVCELIYLQTDVLLFRALAFAGFYLNLFNLTPLGFLDGGRIVTALSPWLWVVGFVVMVFLAITHVNPIVILILFFSVPRLFSLFRRKTDEEKRYYEVTPEQRAVMGGLYFGLIALLVLGMHVTHFDPEEIRPDTPSPKIKA